VPRFEPFRGLRYAAGEVRLDQVIAPPYDVISSAERVTLANRHPANSVLVELPEPDLAAGLDRYQVAAAHLTRWIATGIVVEDPVPAFYAYRTTTPDGHVSTGVIGALGVEERTDGDILPHEQTMPKPRSDRLDLLRATRANLSPIWGLSLAAGLTKAIPTEGDPDGDAFDDAGVRHQLWVVDDSAATEAIRTIVAGAPVVIADGHHRYETARAYRAEARAANDGQAGDHDLVMALMVELAEDQLSVEPIHRLLTGLPEGTDLPALFGRWFDVVHAGPASQRVVSALGDSHSLALVTEEGAWLLTPRTEAYEAAGSDLDSSVVTLALAGLPDHEHTYQHSWELAFEAVSTGRAQAAVLLRPATVAQIAEWAAARRRMPPKTTYFTPKPRTGMVFRPLAG
jgi:uncharacterized protein (DUF1015 family)